MLLSTFVKFASLTEDISLKEYVSCFVFVLGEGYNQVKEHVSELSLRDCVFLVPFRSLSALGRSWPTAMFWKWSLKADIGIMAHSDNSEDEPALGI